MGTCCCLQICNSVVNIVMMGLVLGPSLMVIPNSGVLLYAKVSSLYNVLCECRYCLQVNYTVYKHFDRSLHVRSLDPTYVNNFRFVPLTGFEILGFKLKNENKIGEMDFLPYLPCS